jgi:hypothetical protein
VILEVETIVVVGMKGAERKTKKVEVEVEEVERVE